MEEEMRIGRVALSLIFVLLISVNLYSSTLVYMELKDILNRSEAVVRGVVREVESRYNEERTKIFTYTLIEVKETINGKTPPVITVQTYGGKVGDINMKVPGMPEFKKGEEVLLFVKKVEDFYHIVGMIQGKYSIQKSESGEEYLINDFRDIAFKKVGVDNKLEDLSPSEISSRIKYSDFIKNIKSLIKPESKPTPTEKTNKGK